MVLLHLIEHEVTQHNSEVLLLSILIVCDEAFDVVGLEGAG